MPLALSQRASIDSLARFVHIHTHRYGSESTLMLEIEQNVSYLRGATARQRQPTCAVAELRGGGGGRAADASATGAAGAWRTRPRCGI